MNTIVRSCLHEAKPAAAPGCNYIGNGGIGCDTVLKNEGGSHGGEPANRSKGRSPFLDGQF
jgi:hypothetical protein